MNTASVEVQMEIQIRNQISKYYEAWTVCDEPTCRNRTRLMGVYGRRCRRQGCRGTVAFEVRFCGPFFSSPGSHPRIYSRSTRMSTSTISFDSTPAFSTLKRF